MTDRTENRRRAYRARRMAVSAALAAGILILPLTETKGTAQGNAPTYTVLYNFTGGADGGNPYAALIRDAAGNLYGSTVDGGNAGSSCPLGSTGCGVVFKLDPAGNETVLYTFTGGADGGIPTAGLIRDAAGNLYGTTEFGGTSGAGLVFKLDPLGNETVLYSFTGAADGGYPDAGLIRDAVGDLYGTTQFGGNLSRCYRQGCGVVFKLEPAGNESVLYSFTGGADGSEPVAGLILDANGNLGGTTEDGGTYGGGTVFKVDQKGNETVFHSFTGGADGGSPLAGLLRDRAGNIYGTSTYGGAYGGGVVFKLSPH